ncbi:MAG TPA: substrate-binding domain-containing protein [Actinoplanes sp.]|nr:substrate-binding domain-containing protein [Actinoplanes sp.]
MSDNEWSEPPPERSRVLLSAALVVVVLLAAGGVAWKLMSNGSVQPVTQATAAPVPSVSRPAVAPCPDPELTVAVAPEIEPVIRAAADSLKPAGQRCAPILVRAEESGVTLDSKDRPDVWVPSSSSWLTIANQRKLPYKPSGATLAWSPIVLTAPESMVALYSKDGKPAWTSLLQAVTDGRIPVVTMPDPLRTTTGLLSVHGVHAAAALTTEDPGIAQLRALTLRSRLEEADADPVSVLNLLATQDSPTDASYSVGVYPMVEQQLLAYRKAGHKVALAGGPPVDGMVQADYPYAVRKGVKTGLVEQLRSAISRKALEEAGFRTEPTAGSARLPDSAAGLLTPAQQWAQFEKLAFQVLLLIDASGSMGERIGTGADTKASLLRESGVSAADLFDQDTTIGMWYFGAASANSPAHTEEVPFGPITAAIGDTPRRDLLAEKIGSYRPIPSAGTPLYQSVLDGIDSLRKDAEPNRPAVVVVLTDGADGGTRFTMSNQQFLQKIAAGRDPGRPVPVIAVGYGPDANMTALQSMAKATGGQAIAARNPADLASAMAKAFLAARSTP